MLWVCLLVVGGVYVKRGLGWYFELGEVVGKLKGEVWWWGV